jgi:ankyrin repeat protein
LPPTSRKPFAAADSVRRETRVRRRPLLASRFIRDAARFDGMKSNPFWVILCSLAGLLAVSCGPGKPDMPLHTAVQEGNYPVVRHHIAAKSDLNAKDKAGWTALPLAAMKGDLPMVQLLATAGADVNRPGPGGKTPLDVAREKGRKPVVEFLEARVQAAAAPAPEQRGRGLIDGGLGVSDVLDAN